MHLYKVGELYNPSRTSWPEVAQYNYRAGEHELVIFLAGPSQAEIDGIRKGDAEFALLERGGAIYMLYRFEGALPWSDAPYSWHRVPETERQIPETELPDQRVLVSVILVDAATGIIKVLRAVTLSPSFTRALHKAIRDQSAKPYDQAAYDAGIEVTYRRYPDTRDMVRDAIARCHGGD